jgi:hypothetical protein
MKAFVIKNDNGIIEVKINRSSKKGTLYNRQYDLKLGDIVEVKRVSNNPYLIRVNK